MFGIGTQELLLILLVALLLFGGKRIPEVSRSLGKGMAEIRRAMRDVQREVDLEMLKAPEPERRGPTTGPAAGPPGVDQAPAPPLPGGDRAPAPPSPGGPTGPDGADVENRRG